MLDTIFHHLQRQLFPALAAELGPLSALDQQFCQVISLTELGRCNRRYEWCGNGVPSCPRTWLAHAFIAKHAYQFPTTGTLIDALRSRPRLRQFCAGTVPVKSLQPRRRGHRSPHAQTPFSAPAAPRKRGRPRQGEVRRSPAKSLERQPGRTLAENLADLPARCDMGCKRNSKGHQESWIGYKLHLDTVDGDFPVSAVLTSASVHDSQVAIPLAQLTAGRVTSLYDLMDSAYDAPQIHAFRAFP